MYYPLVQEAKQDMKNKISYINFDEYNETSHQKLKEKIEIKVIIIISNLTLINHCQPYKLIFMIGL